MTKFPINAQFNVIFAIMRYDFPPLNLWNDNFTPLCSVNLKFGVFEGWEIELLHSILLRARLVIEFENCCLKRCENYCLKSVVKKRVF